MTERRKLSIEILLRFISSRLSHALFEGDKASAHTRYIKWKEESIKIKRGTCKKSAELALACC